jgi:hypothetical protein
VAAPAKPARKPITNKQRLDVRPVKTRRSSVPTPPQALPTSSKEVEIPGDKPLTVGRAMKSLIAGINKFTGEELRAQLLADPVVAKLMEDSSTGVVQANLAYWAKQGYLNMVGETPLVARFTVANRDWFTK